MLTFCRPPAVRKGTLILFVLFVFLGSAATQDRSSGAGPLKTDPPPKSAAQAGARWVNIGPAPIVGYFQPSSGRVADLAVDPSNPDHWLIGAAEGGVWESADAGSTWIPRTDDQPSLAIGAVAFAPGNPNILYAGTGEPFTQDGYNGKGLLKSVDGGVSWRLLGAETFSELAFRKIEVDPADSDTLLAAVSDPPRETEFPVKPPGLFKSTDGGMSWTKNLEGSAADLARDPRGFSRFYAGIWSGAATGLYRSVDAGESWTPISGPWSGASGRVGRMALAVASSRPDVVYVSIQDLHTDGLLGLWRSDDAWDAAPGWTEIALPFREFQMHRNHTITVDPANPDVVYLGGTRLWKFDGAQWTDARRDIHVDQQRMAWAGTRLLVGNDGGVFSTTDGGKSWSSHNTNLSITQFYKGSLHPSNPDVILAGSEDNGNGLWTGSNTWRDVFVGDGADNAISSRRPDTDWAASSFDLKIFRTKDGGATFSRADSGIDKTGAPFIASFEKCPSNDDIFIAGAVTLWKSADFFSAALPSWSPNGPPPAAGDEVRAMAFAPSDVSCNTYIFGTKNGSLQRTSDGGRSWVDLDPGDAVPNRPVTDLAFHPADPNTLYVTLAGFDEEIPSKPGHLFKTENALSASPGWSDISPPADVPHNTVLLDPADPNLLYVGTDRGIWTSGDGGGTWTVMGPESGMPNVAVLDLKADAATGRLAAFTHGRGAFLLTAGAARTGMTAAIAADPPSGAAPLTVHFDGAGSSDSDGSITAYIWKLGDGTTGSGPRVDHTYAANGTYTATLTVSDGAGRSASAQKAIRVGARGGGGGSGGGCALTDGGDGANLPRALSFFLTVLFPFGLKAARRVGDCLLSWSPAREQAARRFD